MDSREEEITEAMKEGKKSYNLVKTLSIAKVESKTSAEYLHFRNQKPYPGADVIGEQSLYLAYVAKNLAKTKSGAKDFYYPMTKELNNTQENVCPANPDCDPKAKFRTLDGSCNNLERPKLGMSFTPLRRILPNDYSDGIMLPRVSSTGDPLPSARLVSTITTNNATILDTSVTALFVAFGQFLDHDLDQVPFNSNPVPRIKKNHN